MNFYFSMSFSQVFFKDCFHFSRIPSGISQGFFQKFLHKDSLISSSKNFYRNQTEDLFKNSLNNTFRTSSTYSFRNISKDLCSSWRIFPWMSAGNFIWHCSVNLIFRNLSRNTCFKKFCQESLENFHQGLLWRNF